MKEVTEERLNKYFKLTEEALGKIKIKVPKEVDLKIVAEDFLDMAERYFQDAKHFAKQGDLVTAFAAVSYAHAWLDAGARLGVFDVHDSRLFTVDDE